MTKLVWNEGMSVGVDAIDEDHKKIISVLAKLVDSKNTQASLSVVEETFSELEHYVIQHFTKEEALLEKIGYKEIEAHRRSHLAFVEKIAVLKQQWLSQNSDEISNEITDYLQRWLLEHILQEDLDFVPALHSYNKILEYQEYKKSKHPFLRFFSKKLAQYISISQRVFLTTLSPVIVLLVLCFVLLKDSYLRYQNVSLLYGLNTVVAQVNTTSHSLQSERGLSSGYASSNYQEFSERLAKRRIITDAKLAKFLLLMDLHVDDKVKQSISQYAQNAREAIKTLHEHRLLLDKGVVSVQESNFVYTRLISQLLSISESLIRVDAGSQLVNDISAINAILLFKEYMGQIRATGMDLLQEDYRSIYDNSAISMLVGKQLNALRDFSYSASEEQKQICIDYCNEQTQQQLVDHFYQNVVHSYASDERSNQWFIVMSNEIDNIKLVTEQLIADFNKKVQQEADSIETTYIWVLVALVSFFVLSTLFALVLNYSIISPVRKLTYALNDMSAGQTHIQFTHIISNDEIAAMQKAYEKLRRKLMQADIYKARVSDQQKEIQYRKSQQDHFQQLALTDALTGAVNRHHFNDVLGREITNVNEHGRPLSIMVLDIDHFKQINDTYGHVVGDEVLIMFYRTCKQAVRNTDVVARIGGEEFVIVMPNTSLDSAKQFAERLRKSIAELEIEVDGNQVSLTVSIGVSQWHAEQFINAETFIAHADKSLYQAKKSGRNKVVVADSLCVEKYSS
ncbi:bacteriohemerythrin [Litorilituus sediminis]|uniref:diguanylate cyclase n=1 Tax=Litorilituus sediminis TaxID=718192 RepID=A0A4P6PCL2_9GAMM|nr:bacteriohemerythrin [Litorilituus sediminis]QBG37502.1 diguanylate cyclase [Litorilituus sediminis]